MTNFFKKLTIYSSLILLSACDTAPTQSQPQQARTPLQQCLHDANYARLTCGLGMDFRNAQGQMICDDRKMMQVDRCHARFK